MPRMWLRSRLRWTWFYAPESSSGTGRRHVMTGKQTPHRKEVRLCGSQRHGEEEMSFDDVAVIEANGLKVSVEQPEMAIARPSSA